MALWFALAALFSWLLAGLLMKEAAASSPSAKVAVFHRRLASGQLENIDEFFAFPAAYNYWCDIAVSLGIPRPRQEDFRVAVARLLAADDVRAELSSYRPVEFRQKIVGEVGSVVFRKEGAPPGNDSAAVSVVLEDGRWKIMTYPGVFPGRMLVEARRDARSAREGREHR